MRTQITRLVCGLGLLVMLGVSTPADANSGNASCGQPTNNGPNGGGGSLTVVVTLEGKPPITVSWNVAGILKTDSPAEKARKIRAAAPPTNDHLESQPAPPGGSGTVAGGTDNVVSVTAKAGDKITGIAFKDDNTGENERFNLFSCAPYSDGLGALAGIASGLDGSGEPAAVMMSTASATAFVPTQPGMPAEVIEQMLLQQLLAGGAHAHYASPTWLTEYFPSLVCDGQIIQIEALGEQGLMFGCSDTGLVQSVCGVIDTYINYGAWADDFDSYAVGSSLQCQEGWKGWDDNPSAAGTVVAGPTDAATNQALIEGSADTVHEFATIDSGVWAFTVQQYVPGAFVSGGADPFWGSYMILLNRYADGGAQDYDSWSVQLHADSRTDSFIRDGVTPTSLPLIRDQWVEVRVRIDLNHDIYRVFYGGTELGAAESWTGTVYGGGGGSSQVEALDLPANSSTAVYYDDMSLTQVVLGDMNCDGVVTFDDINPLVLALSDPAGYAAAQPGCDILNGDCNGDGLVNFDDINPFIGILTGG